ncbi:restriction endonuclease [Kitasatospora kifunensis]|uniref:Restriction system protein n=1 Tax=Kitasatospora kifunensis TaxID=58351 RepID=A0A7W7R8Y4_KITKI|nr:restriction endonuclease [Kitasatospora kifunensis]MBB4927632.1 restriction system protein [Kitasatospora kifunensis]
MTSRRPARRTGRTGRTKNDDFGALVAGVLALLLITFMLLLTTLHAAENHPAIAVLIGAGLVGLLVLLARRRLEQRRHRQQAAWREQQIQATRSYEIAPYHHMNSREFEHALAYLCRRDGCRDVQVIGGAGDLAADVIATAPDGRRIVIQAKRFGPNTTVGSGDVQKVNGTYRDVHGGHLAAIVTTSRFTKPAAELAHRVGIRTFDANALAGWASRTGPAPWH